MIIHDIFHGSMTRFVFSGVIIGCNFLLKNYFSFSN